MHHTPFCQQLGINTPIIKAPMAGGVDSPALVAAVSANGGLGFIGGAYLSPEQLAEDATRVRALTDKAFAINLFLPEPVTPQPDCTAALEAISPLYAELDLAPPAPPAYGVIDFEAQLQVSLDSDACALSFTFGLPDPAIIAACHTSGKLCIGTATSAEEARLLSERGIDAIVAQGSEAGGHRGGFLPGTPMIGTLALLPLICAVTDKPVIAAGGIMNGQGIQAALTLGASAVALGTAFMACPEADIPEAYKQALSDSQAEQSRLTRAFSGRPARGIVNRAMEILDEADAILPFPWQNSLTRPLRSASARANNADYLSLWAGQGAPLARRLPAAELMVQLKQEAGLAD